MIIFCNHRHGLANSTVHFSLSCNGSETHVLNCQQLPIINESCSHRNDIEIICCKLTFVAKLNKQRIQYYFVLIIIFAV